MPPIFMHSYMVQHLLDQQYDLEAKIMELNDQKESLMNFSTSIESSTGSSLFDSLAEVPMELLGSAAGLEQQWAQSITGFMNSPFANTIIEQSSLNAARMAQANGGDASRARGEMAQWTFCQLMRQRKEDAKKSIAKIIDRKCKDIDKQLHQFQKQKMIVDSRLQAEQQAEAQGVQQTNWGYSLGGGGR